jgi:beta-keto acid cleavage enzyme
MSRIIITAAVNGNRLDTPGVHIQVSPEEIAEDARRCHDAGAAVVQFHARDVMTRRSTPDRKAFTEAIAAIRVRCPALIEATTGAGPRIDPGTGKPMVDPATCQIMRPSDDERLALIDLDPPQDLSSVLRRGPICGRPCGRRPSFWNGGGTTSRVRPWDEFTPTVSLPGLTGQSSNPGVNVERCA